MVTAEKIRKIGRVLNFLTRKMGAIKREMLSTYRATIHNWVGKLARYPGNMSMPL
jgi:hypothetical protein